MIGQSKNYEWKPTPTRLAGRPKIRWENDRKEDLRIVNLNNWIKYSQDQVKWKQYRRPKLSHNEASPDKE